MANKICRRTGKVGYRSISEARAAAERAAATRSLAREYERRKTEVSAFKCLWCPRWHLSSQRQTGKGVNFDEGDL